MKTLKRLSKEERLKIILDIISKLKTIPANNDIGYINMWKMDYSAIKTIKKIFDDYISEEESQLIERRGKIFFEELNRNIVYLLPANERVKAIFKMEYIK
jgi:hypothetical protein